MPLATYDLSIGVFVRGLTNLKTVLQKGEQYAARRNIPEADLLARCLASDMHNLRTQLHWAAEGSKRAVGRLLGTMPVISPDDATTFAVHHERISSVILQLETTSPEALEASLGRTIEIEHPGGVMRFTGEQFLREFAIPNFFFHLTCAFAILRNAGVDVTKGDFMGFGR